MEEMVEERDLMIVLTATTKPDFVHSRYLSQQWSEIVTDIHFNQPNIGVVAAYHQLWERHRDEDIQVYVHDDLEVFAPDGLERVAVEMLNRNVAIVGLGGATGIGAPEIYKRPFRTEHLVRVDYCSNQDDWEIHGSKETGSLQVAVVDGFFMAIKGSFLEDVQGWNWIQSNFHCYDTAMCLEAYRRGWAVRMVGVPCHHQGGGTSTKPEYLEWCKEHGTTPKDEHLKPHGWMYDRYRDILPLRI
jgi:hypothetical protein